MGSKLLLRPSSSLWTRSVNDSIWSSFITDDILVTSPEEAAHKLDLHVIELFEQHREHSLVIIMAKFQFGQFSTNYLAIISHLTPLGWFLTRSPVSLTSGNQSPLTLHVIF